MHFLNFKLKLELEDSLELELGDRTVRDSELRSLMIMIDHPWMITPA